MTHIYFSHEVLNNANNIQFANETFKSMRHLRKGFNHETLKLKMRRKSWHINYRLNMHLIA